MSLLVTFGLSANLAHALTVDFEDLSLPVDSFYNGSDGAGGFVSRDTHFANLFDEQFGSWFGWSVSNTTDATTAGFGNQYSSFAGGGSDGSANYGVVFFDVLAFFPEDSRIRLPPGHEPVSMRVSNTTYTALSMRDGDSFAKRFGGSGGDDGDFLKLVILALNDADEELSRLDYYLADYRFADNSQDFILEGWHTVDLAPLRGDDVVALTFRMESSDNHPTFGMNTPGYFALDDLVLRSTDQVPGDLTGDGLVTRADAATFASSLGATHDPTLGALTLRDLAMIQANLRPSVGASVSRTAVVPEPSGRFLLALALVAFVVVSRARQPRRTSRL